MVDSLDADGLTISSASEITEDLVVGMRAIYGPDINTDSNSPDGQMIGIITQAAIDIRELIQKVNASFDPDQSVGTILDQRVAINNIQREGGTYTIQPIVITVNQTVTLEGLDADFNDPNGTGFTVQDSSGNQFILESTTTLTAGATTCNFRAQKIGLVNVPINTITNAVTIVVGVTGINNATAAVTIGQNEETDAQLRVRRQQSVANATTGFLNGLLGKIRNLDGVTEAEAYQNNSDVTDASGTKAHYMWLIVAGGSSADIANVLYNTINGAGMRGLITQNITTPSGATFTAAWDVPISESLYINFTIQRTVAGSSFNLDGIKSAMAAALTYGIGKFAETSAPTVAALAAINSLGGGGVPVLMSISDDDITFTDFIEPTGLQYQFTVAASNINITVV